MNRMVIVKLKAGWSAIKNSMGVIILYRGLGLADFIPTLVSNHYTDNLCPLITALCFSNGAVMPSLDIRLSVCNVGEH